MPSANGTTAQRKTLSSQLDRLDDILDCLGDGLNQAVRDAVKEGVGEAVRVSVKETLQAVIQEVVSNPDWLQTLRTMLVPDQPSLPENQADPVRESEQQKSPPRRWGARFWSWISPIALSKWGWMQGTASSVREAAKVLWHHRWSALSLAGIGVAVGVASFLLGPVPSSILAGLGGASIAVLLVAGMALYRVCALAKELEPAS